MVLTRPILDGTGRTKTMRLIHRVLDGAFDVEVLRLHSLVETRRFGDVLFAAAFWVLSLLRGTPQSLQCMLFASRSSCSAAVSRIAAGNFDAVYVDMVRSAYFMRRLRAANSSFHVVLDLDDLLSRRAAYQARDRNVSMGFLAGHVPRSLRYLVEKLLPARLVYRYESRCLERTEREMLEHADAAVLVSDVEREVLASRVPLQLSARVASIPPPARIVRDAITESPIQRFVFIGSDSYLPNRTAIDFLLDTWRRHQIAVPLHIYGRQTRAIVSQTGVSWHGFVADIAEAYEVGTAALAPLTLPGGIKTKVVESWSFGCPVLGTPEALEGLVDATYPLCMPLPLWARILRNPSEAGDAWIIAARQGQALVRERLSEDAFRAAWLAQFRPAGPVF